MALYSVSAIKAELGVRMESRSTGPAVIQSARLRALTPYPLICLTDLWGVFLPACFFLYSFPLTLLALPASFVEFFLTDSFSLPFRFYSRWLKLRAGVWPACEQFLHLLKQQFTPKTVLRDTMMNVGLHRLFGEMLCLRVFIWCMFFVYRQEDEFERKTKQSDFGVDCLL